MAQALTINANGLRFDAIAEGPADADLVLMLHGFPQFADSWLPLMHVVSAAGFRAVAVNQRGYSPDARPEELGEYAIEKLVSDVDAFANALGGRPFHLVGHDWGAFVAWIYAAKFPHRLRSLTALSTPHPDALSHARDTDADQQQRSQYITLFRMSDGAAERVLLADNGAMLRRAFQGKLSEKSVRKNVGKMSKPGALTAALNWYRALKPGRQVGKVTVPTLYVWGSDDLALGRTAALDTANYVDGPYRFEELQGKSHWLLEEVPGEVAGLVLQHLHRSAPRPRHSSG